MVARRVLLVVVLLLALAALGQSTYWATRLPERVASHFDMSDRVNGWMDRSAFLMLTVLVQLLMAGLFVALPLLLGRIPDTLINLPNKDYWLAAERREQSLAALSSRLLAIGCATLLLLLVIFQGVFALNADLARSGGPAGGSLHLVLPLPFPVLMGLYLLVVGVILASMLLRFRKPA